MLLSRTSGSSGLGTSGDRRWGAAYGWDAAAERGRPGRRVGMPLRILILNWRDPHHPRAGGAERATYELARRWVSLGHQVTWFAASFPGSRDRDVLDGIDLVRAGSQVSVPLHAFLYYRRIGREQFDVVIDEVNTVPFLAPLYARVPTLLYVHQLTRSVWFYEAPLPLACVGYLLEPFWLQVYRTTPILTVSPSTARDIRRFGLRGAMSVVLNGVDTALPALPDRGEKATVPTLLYVGRVTASKRVPALLSMVAYLKHEERVIARLQILGTLSHRDRRSLLRRAHRLGVSAQLELLGRQSEEAKRALMISAHLLVMASVREGWGLAVSEAAGCGTPAVVYDVPGLRDSTVDGVTGLLATVNTPRHMARAVAGLLRDSDTYERMRVEGWRRARAMTWDAAAVQACRCLTAAQPAG